MKHLCDSNVLLAIAVGQHLHHPAAAQWFSSLASNETAWFCKATRMSFLRLLTHKIAPEFTPLSNRQAWKVYHQLMEDAAMGMMEEPRGMDENWQKWSSVSTASTKVWMDSYLAAFAVSSGMRLVTFDKDFRKYVPFGLDLLLLKS